MITQKFNGFTTKPTIKPACGGCGYVTLPTTSDAKANKFQTQSFPTFQGGQQGGGFEESDYATPSLGVSQALQKQPFDETQQIVPPSEASQAYQQAPAVFLPTSPPSGANQVYQKQAPAGSQGSHFDSGASQSRSPSPATNPLAQQPLQFPSNQNQIDYSDASGPTTPPSSSSSQTSNLNPYDYGDIGGQAPFIGTGSPVAHVTSEAPKSSAPLSQVTISNGAIHVPGNPDIPIIDKYPNMQDGLPEGIEEKDITDLLYKFNYTIGFSGHYEKGYKNGAKVGGYFVNGRDGISRVVTYVADENGYRPKFKFINLGLDSPDTPKAGTEKKFGLKNFEFVWYPIK